MLTDDVPQVSVIIPVYNSEMFLSRTLDGLLASTYKNFEIIIIDDGSTDGSSKIIQGISENRALRTFVFRQDNAGEVSAVNRGFSFAQGEFVMVLSSDDLIGPRLLESAIREFQLNPDLGVVYPDWYEINDEDSVILDLETRDFSTQTLVGEVTCLPGPGTVFRRSLVSRPYLRDRSFPLSSDLELWFWLSSRTLFKKISGFHAAWRRHASSQSVTNGPMVRVQEQIRLLNRYFDHAETNKSICPHYADAYSTMFARFLIAFLGQGTPSTSGFPFPQHFSIRWPSLAGEFLRQFHRKLRKISLRAKQLWKGKRKSPEWA